MAQFLIKPEARKKVASMNLADDFQNAHIPRKLLSGIIACAGLIFAAAPWVAGALSDPNPDNAGMLAAITLAVTVIGLFFAGIGLFGPIMAKKQRRNVLKDLERIEKYHGGADKVFSEVMAQVADEFPVYTIESGQHLTKDWFISPAPARLVKLSDIVCIIGIDGAGTFIIISDGEMVEVMFGKKTWGDTFELFQSANPYILYNDDEVTLASGKVGDARDAFHKKDFASITQAYNRRKEEGLAYDSTD